MNLKGQLSYYYFLMLEINSWHICMTLHFSEITFWPLSRQKLKKNIFACRPIGLTDFLIGITSFPVRPTGFPSGLRYLWWLCLIRRAQWWRWQTENPAIRSDSRKEKCFFLEFLDISRLKFHILCPTIHMPLKNRKFNLTVPLNLAIWYMIRSGGYSFICGT